jgi:GNAT superfamily N-acetyltransferase
MAEIVVRKPSDLSPNDLKVFEDLVIAGGEVRIKGLTERIRRAEWLVFLREGGTVAGVAALKRPDKRYRERVFAKAKAKEEPTAYPLEAGWIYVVEKYRRKGFSRVLLEAVLQCARREGVYATTGEDNEWMRSTNNRCGLEQSGFPYPSDKGGYKLILYIRRPSP